MKRYHPTAYLFAVSRACGGSRQDIGVEGAVAVLMNTPYYLEFLIWRMRCGHTDGILERNLYMLLRSVEMISFLRVVRLFDPEEKCCSSLSNKSPGMALRATFHGNLVDDTTFIQHHPEITLY